MKDTHNEDQLQRFMTEGVHAMQDMLAGSGVENDGQMFAASLAMAFHMTNRYPLWWGIMASTFVSRSGLNEAWDSVCKMLTDDYPVQGG